MKKFYYLVFLFFIWCAGSAQNLVPNGDFEQYNGCPIFYSNYDSVLFWFSPTDGTPDYYNNCAHDSTTVSVPLNWPGYQQPHSGVAYTGLFLFAQGINYYNHREYIEVSLTNTLVANVCYYFEMYLSLANSSNWTTDDIGVYLSNTPIDSINSWLPLNLIPQIVNTSGNITDTLNWILISGTYLANGGENYMIIGNFLNDAATTQTLTNNSVWNDGCYILIDDVLLTTCTGINDIYDNQKVSVYPNPAFDKLIIELQGTDLAKINIFDTSLRRIITKTFSSFTTIDFDKYQSGTYFYELTSDEKIVKRGKIIKL